MSKHITQFSDFQGYEVKLTAEMQSIDDFAVIAHIEFTKAEGLANYKRMAAELLKKTDAELAEIFQVDWATAYAEQVSPMNQSKSSFQKISA